ncbi:DUF397 domain-containing protein [Glycomyces salinus]|uniref:DUF397 domain-containing protein n=1 Tax=Glycomyces salinus TaxID=980294 RepID=UPI0018EB1F05|nr:DUF397 domain-containing protein [Glycomyces salinus]
MRTSQRQSRRTWRDSPHISKSKHDLLRSSDVTDNAWRKAKASGADGNNCVEVRMQDGSFQVRDSKLGDASPVLAMTPDQFTALLNEAAQRLPNPVRAVQRGPLRPLLSAAVPESPQGRCASACHRDRRAGPVVVRGRAAVGPTSGDQRRKSGGTVGARSVPRADWPRAAAIAVCRMSSVNGAEGTSTAPQGEWWTWRGQNMKPLQPCG